MTGTELYVFNSADWTMDFSMMVQMRNIGEPYAGKCPFYLVDHPEGTVLFDTGVSYEMKQDPENYGTHGAPHMAGFVGGIDMDESDKPVHQLEAAGYAPSDVDYVVLSHLHTDHAGNVTDFPDAEIVVQQEELRYAFWPESSQRLFYLEGDFGALRSPAYSVTAIDGAYDVFGDGSVVTIPTPGHSPGHQSLRVELENEGTVVLAADVANHRVGYEQEIPASFAWSLPDSIDSIRRIRREERERDARVLIHHDQDDIEPLPEPPESLD